MKWQLRQRHGLVFFRNNVVIIPAASPAFYLQWFAILNYVLKDGLAFRYFLVGMLAVAMLFAYFRYWLALFFGARIGHYLYLGVPERSNYSNCTCCISLPPLWTYLFSSFWHLPLGISGDIGCVSDFGINT
jgi:hypothetical protein